MPKGNPNGNLALMRPGVSGNPNGRPLGGKNLLCLNRTALYELFNNSAPDLIKKCIEMAMDGDTKAMAICMDRLVPKVNEPLQIEVTSFALERELMDAIKEKEKEY